jgi:tetratricopeptide (TPR) repeat protein
VGAGCSVSANIPAAPGVARHCALKLARIYSSGRFKADDPEAALDWLVKHRKISLPQEATSSSDGSHWGQLYQYFFEHHFKAPNQQREIIIEIIGDEDQINWAHACLGELVRLKYVHTVLTTNFDQLVLQGIVRAGIWPVTADGIGAVNRIIGTPKRPQVVHLHGSMHTYNLRNSTAALAETERDSGTVTMIHSLLQQSDMLVVVGYGGGEEGVMHLLRDAASTMPQLVIYWITYEGGRDTLSPNALALLNGENKFLIRGGPADRLFGDLMAELGIGQPQWVGDPVTCLKAQSEQLITPTSEDLHAIGILVRAYKERVAFANDVEHRWPEANETKVRAAELRARGDFAGARTELETINLAQDNEAKRLHALNAKSLFEIKSDASMLDLAIREFTELVDATTEDERFNNVISMIDALFDYSDLKGEDSQEGTGALKKVISATDHWQKVYTREMDAKCWAQLRLRSARAKQILAESGGEDVALLQESQAEYQDAIEGFGLARSTDVDLIDAKAGLAAVLQVLGQKQGPDEATLRRSVELFREVLDQSRSFSGRTEDAGPLFNLSGAVVALGDVVPAEEASILLEDARIALETAIQIYDQQGEGDQVAAARERLDQVLDRINNLRPKRASA